MSYEAWGDGDDGQDYDHLLDAGWLTSEQAADIRHAITALRAEQIYENGKKQNGISVAFLMRITLLEDAAGLREPRDPMVTEAEQFFAAAER